MVVRFAVAQSLKMEAVSGTIRVTRNVCVHCPNAHWLATLNDLWRIGKCIEMTRVVFSVAASHDCCWDDRQDILPMIRPVFWRCFLYDESGGSCRSQSKTSDAHNWRPAELIILSCFLGLLLLSWECGFWNSRGGSGVDIADWTINLISIWECKWEKCCRTFSEQCSLSDVSLFSKHSAKRKTYSIMNEATLIANSKVVFACSKCLENSATLDFLNAILKLVTNDLFVNPACILVANSDILQICLWHCWRAARTEAIWTGSDPSGQRNWTLKFTCQNIVWERGLRSASDIRFSNAIQNPF